MDGLFSQEGCLYRFLNRLWDLIILNFLFILTSIPIVTIGASLTALYTVLLHGVRQEDGYIIKSYFKSFRENFRKSTFIFLLIAGMWVVMGVDVFMVGNSGRIGTAFVFAAGIFGMIWLLVTIYVFPLLARFENSIPYTLLNSFIAAVKYLSCTLQLIGIFSFVPAVGLALGVLWPTGLSWFLAIIFFVGFSGIAWMAAFPYRKVTDSLIAQSDTGITHSR